MTIPTLAGEETLNQREAANYLGVSPGTLWNWANENRGPKFTRFSKCTIKYKKRDLDDFIASKTGTANQRGIEHE